MNYFYKLFFNNAYLLLCLAMLGWAGNTIAGRLSTGEISPNTIVFLRWLIVSIFLLLIQRKVIFKSISKLLLLDKKDRVYTQNSVIGSIPTKKPPIFL